MIIYTLINVWNSFAYIPGLNPGGVTLKLVNKHNGDFSIMSILSDLKAAFNDATKASRDIARTITMTKAIASGQVAPLSGNLSPGSEYRNIRLNAEESLAEEALALKQSQAKELVSQIKTADAILARRSAEMEAIAKQKALDNPNPAESGTINKDATAETASAALAGSQVTSLPRSVASANRAPAVVRVNSDMRVRIMVPPSYLTEYTTGFNNELSVEGIGGVIFPYTPTISYEHKAEYASSNPTHSNFTIYSYQRSSVSGFTITGKFTVQNNKDAGVYLATLRLLSALTKMRKSTDNALVGASPPPVCRLRAYGESMMDNVPIAITGVKIDYPDNVDYYSIDAGESNSGQIYQAASVPTISTISVSCIPMYSRGEMQQFSVTGWLNNTNGSNRRSGYL